MSKKFVKKKSSKNSSKKFVKKIRQKGITPSKKKEERKITSILARPIRVLRNFARPQADGELKNVQNFVGFLGYGITSIDILLSRFTDL